MGEPILKNEPFPYILIDDFYNQSELDGIWEELDYLCNPKRMGRSSLERGAAGKVDENGVYKSLKNTWDMRLDAFYTSRDSSNILEVNRKLLNSVDIFKNHPHWAINDVNSYQDDFTQLVYYEDNDEYRVHRDYSNLTCLTWFYREPKKFTGGNLCFPMWDIEIECKHNRVLCFPSSIPHKATKISMEKNDLGKKLGRFVMGQFFVFRNKF